MLFPLCLCSVSIRFLYCDHMSQPFILQHLHEVQVYFAAFCEVRDGRRHVELCMVALAGLTQVHTSCVAQRGVSPTKAYNFLGNQELRAKGELVCVERTLSSDQRVWLALSQIQTENLPFQCSSPCHLSSSTF